MLVMMAGRGAGAQVDMTGCGFDPHSRILYIKYFHFFAIVTHQLTRNAVRIWRKMENRVS